MAEIFNSGAKFASFDGKDYFKDIDLPPRTNPKLR